MGKKSRLQQVIVPTRYRVIALAQAVDEFDLALRVGQRTDQTLAYYRKNLTRFLTWAAGNDLPADMARIEAQHIRRWLVHLQDETAAGAVSIQTYYRAVRAFFNWCEKQDMIPVSPFHKLDYPKAAQRIKATYSDDELLALLDACVRGENALRDTALVLTLIDTGLREAEVCSLHVSELERGRLKVLGKGAKERFLAISPRTEKALRDYVRRERTAVTDEATRDVLFLGRKGALTPTGVYQIIKRRAKAVGIANWNVHKFRHTFALLFARSGASLQALQAILGHETAAMSMRYGHWASVDAEEQHRQHSPVARLGEKKGRR